MGRNSSLAPLLDRLETARMDRRLDGRKHDLPSVPFVPKPKGRWSEIDLTSEILEEFSDCYQEHAASPAHCVSAGLRITAQRLGMRSVRAPLEPMPCGFCAVMIDRDERPWSGFCSLECQIKLRQRRLWLARVEAKVCARCGKGPPLVGVLRCATCTETLAKAVKAVCERRTAKGQCRCGEQIEKIGSVYCEPCKVDLAYAARERRAARRVRVPNPVCVICCAVFKQKEIGRPAIVCGAECRAENTRRTMRRIGAEKRAQRVHNSHPSSPATVENAAK